MLTLIGKDIPQPLRRIASPPKELFILGDLDPLLKRPRVGIVGSRKVSAYGKGVTTTLAGDLAAYGVVIISGLALGVDSIAHQAALDAGGHTIAVLPSSLQQVYPAAHRQLAQQIVDRGGALITEYPPGAEMAYKQNFIARNRLIAAMADVLLITEATEKSGSLHTARFALEQGRDVMAVPGNITSITSVGTNNLIKAGAMPVTSVEDVLHVLGIEPSIQKQVAPKGANDAEQTLLDLLAQGISEGSELLSTSQLDASVFNQTLTMLEITGKIRSLGANHWSLR